MPVYRSTEWNLLQNGEVIRKGGREGVYEAQRKCREVKDSGGKEKVQGREIKSERTDEEGWDKEEGRQKKKGVKQEEVKKGKMRKGERRKGERRESVNERRTKKEEKYRWCTYKL